MQIIVNFDDLQVITLSDQKNFNRTVLPENFIQWQSEARLRAFDSMLKRDAAAVRSMPAHLPVLATLSEEAFPINLSTRGIGLLPREEFLSQITDEFIETLEKIQDKPWQETLEIRVNTIRNFYQRPELFDRKVLGGLEIFEGKTLSNLKNTPLAALLYSGEAPKYPSYQFNGIVQLVSGDDLRYRFLLAARELFARDAFHIHQIHYPNGYLFYPVEIKDKTPYPRR